jgi:hypothetical protein
LFAAMARGRSILVLNTALSTSLCHVCRALKFGEQQSRPQRRALLRLFQARHQDGAFCGLSCAVETIKVTRTDLSEHAFDPAAIRSSPPEYMARSFVQPHLP